jgi:hypothetical protein
MACGNFGHGPIDQFIAINGTGHLFHCIHIDSHTKPRTQLSLVVATPPIDDTILAHCQGEGFATRNLSRRVQNFDRLKIHLIDRSFAFHHCPSIHTYITYIFHQGFNEVRFQIGFSITIMTRSSHAGN